MSECLLAVVTYNLEIAGAPASKLKVKNVLNCIES